MLLSSLKLVMLAFNKATVTVQQVIEGMADQLVLRVTHDLAHCRRVVRCQWLSR